MGVVALVACSGEVDTNFGPPGGLSGKQLPQVEFDAGTRTKKDAGMKKCVFKAPKDAGAPAMEASDDASEASAPEGGTAEGGVAEGGTGDGASTGEAGPDLDGSAAPEAAADTGSPDTGAPSTDCKVSWSKDIFPKMTATGAWQCGNAACHGPGSVIQPRMTNDPTTTYDNLAAYSLESPTGTSSRPFLLPCSTNPSASVFLCVTTSSTCGAQMPLTSTGARALTPPEVAAIKTWIGCGAIDN
jgi:hypothetical protein